MADFFKNADELGIVERHAKQILSLEESESKKIIRVYKRIRQDLRDRLDTLPQGTFTHQRLAGVLVQVESAIKAMAESLKGEMDNSALKTAKKGVEDLTKEIKTFSKRFEGAVIPIDIKNVAIAQDTRNLLVNRYQVSIDAYSLDIRRIINEQLLIAVVEKASTDTVVRRLGQYFQAEEWKLRRIARTELHGVYNHGRLNGMEKVKKQYIPDLKKTLIHPIDHRTGNDSKLAKRLDLVVDVNKPFIYEYMGKKRIFMNPPDRPNDRSILVPYRKVWDR